MVDSHQFGNVWAEILHGFMVKSFHFDQPGFVIDFILLADALQKQFRIFYLYLNGMKI